MEHLGYAKSAPVSRLDSSTQPGPFGSRARLTFGLRLGRRLHGPEFMVLISRDFSGHPGRSTYITHILNYSVGVYIMYTIYFDIFYNFYDWISPVYAANGPRKQSLPWRIINVMNRRGWTDVFHIEFTKDQWGCHKTTQQKWWPYLTSQSCGRGTFSGYQKQCVAPVCWFIKIKTMNIVVVSIYKIL